MAATTSRPGTISTVSQSASASTVAPAERKKIIGRFLAETSAGPSVVSDLNEYDTMCFSTVRTV